MEISKDQSYSIKGIAILLLIFHHLFYKVERFQPYGIRCLISFEKLSMIAYESRVCVWLFAFVSAYGIAKSLKQGASSKAINKLFVYRWISLLSSFWFVYPIVYFVSYLTSHDPWGIYQHKVLYLLLDFMGLSDFFMTPTLGGVWWYMSFAQILIVIVFVSYFAIKKIGSLPLLAFLFIASQYISSDVGLNSPYGGRYLMYYPIVIIGVELAVNESKLDILKNKGYKVTAAVVLLAISIFLLYVRKRLSLVENGSSLRYCNYIVQGYVTSIAALGIITSSLLFQPGTKITRVFCFLGKHSGNIFMIHTFFYVYAPQYVYFSKSVLLSVLTLVAYSLLLSIIIEWMKHILRYTQLISWIKEQLIT